MIWKKLLPLVSALLLAGCVTSTFTRVSPLIQPRNANNIYPVEAIFNSPQQALRWDSIKAYVVVNGEPYPMHAVPLMKNRWEGLVPVPASANQITYRFKFDFLINNFGTPPKPNSGFSPIYTLKIVDQ
jgi:hypothetical protein